MKELALSPMIGGISMSHLQKSGRISFNPTLRGFLDWVEGYGDSISRKFNLKKRQSGEEDCRSRLLQVARMTKTRSTP